MPIARHSMWEELARMVRIPFSFTVLQRRRGYRRVLQNFSRIRLAPTIPLDRNRWRDFRMGSGRAPGVQPALLQVAEGTNALLLRAADSRHRSSGPRRAERPAFTCSTRSSGFERSPTWGLLRTTRTPTTRRPRSGRVRSSVQTSTRCTPTATRFRTRGRCGSCTRVGSFGSSGFRGVAFSLAVRPFLHPRGCLESCGALARFRLLRLSGMSRAVVRGT